MFLNNYEQELQRENVPEYLRFSPHHGFIWTFPCNISVLQCSC